MTAPLANDLFLRALLRQPTPRTPSPRTLETDSFAAHRPAKFCGRIRT